MSCGKYRQVHNFFHSNKKKVTKICKDGDESVVSISYKVKFIKDCQCFLEHKRAKDNLIKCKCLSCNKAYSNKIDEELKK